MLPHPLSAASVESDADALLILPKGYLDLRAPIIDLYRVPVGDNITRLFQAFIEEKKSLDSSGNETNSLKPARINLSLRFESGAMVSSCIFGATFAWCGVNIGDQIQFTGQLGSNYYGTSIKSLEIARATGRVHPVYPGVSGKIAADIIDPYVQHAIDDHVVLQMSARKIRENSEVVSVLKRMGFKSGSGFLSDLHRPADPESGYLALKAARMACVKHVQAEGRAYAVTTLPKFNIDQALIEYVKAQPEKLSNGQRRALNVIRNAVNSTASAKILLNGDVGSGKTLVFLLAAAAVASAGKRVAVMVPSELVAKQIAGEAIKRFPELNPVLVVAGAASAVPDSSRMLIGTQGLLNMQMAAPLGMLVIDEQHKLSVAQRCALVSPSTHVIESSATPIPRSLALALFDGWVEARIEGCPVDKTITSTILTPGLAVHAKQSIRQSITEGKKTVMVYPSVKSGEKSAVEAFKRLDEAFPGLIALAHGKLKPKEKDAALNSFRNGQCPILVATTVVEVGVDVPGIATFIVHEAQTFGVSQLHQMRGRLVRDGGHGDFFMMIKENAGKVTLERLEAVRDNLDGFALAERDLELRGFGDVLGEAQTGGTSTFFKLARLEAKDFLV